MTILARYLGPGLVLLFAVSQAFRDVYLAHVFQGIDLFAVVLLAFSISAIGFGTIALLRAPHEFVTMREARDAGLAVPLLLMPSIQVNMRAGKLPPPDANGVRYLKIPVKLVA